MAFAASIEINNGVLGYADGCHYHLSNMSLELQSPKPSGEAQMPGLGDPLSRFLGPLRDTPGYRYRGARKVHSIYV
jgi:hypothetical protein